MKLRRVVIAASTCMLLAACGSKGSSSSTTASAAASARLDSSASPHSSTHADAPRPASSLDSAAYVGLGVPAIDRAWKSVDYQAAVVELKKVPVESYPLVDDPKSGKVFARFVADDNLDFVRDASVAVDQRMPEALDLLEASREVGRLYFDASKSGGRLDDENLSLLDFQIDEASSMLEVVDAFIKKMDPKEDKFPVRVKGLLKMVGGMSEMATGSVMTLSEKAHSTEALLKLSAGLTKSLPKLVARLNDEQRKALVTRLAQAASDEKDPALAPSYNTLLKAVKDEAPAPLEADVPTVHGP